MPAINSNEDAPTNAPTATSFRATSNREQRLRYLVPVRRRLK